MIEIPPLTLTGAVSRVVTSSGAVLEVRAVAIENTLDDRISRCRFVRLDGYATTDEIADAYGRAARQVLLDAVTHAKPARQEVEP